MTRHMPAQPVDQGAQGEEFSISAAIPGCEALAGPFGPSPASAAPTDTPQNGAISSRAQADQLRTELRRGALAKSHGTVAVCGTKHMHCLAEALTVGRGSRTPLHTGAISRSKNGLGRVGPLAQVPPVGYGATELAKAYGLSGAKTSNGTIVVIGAGAYPTLNSDLAIYRATYGLPACTVANHCFRQLNYLGKAPYAPATGEVRTYVEEAIAVETALDVDMASAACPTCKIVSLQVPLIDGYADSTKQLHAAVLHFATAVQTAKKLGASAASISYGYPTDSYSDKGKIAAMMRQPGMAIVSSSGDSGFLADQGQWPQGLATVTSAGGTSLYAAQSSRKYAEAAWNGAGSGCTDDVGPAVGQPKSISKHCDGHRTASDVAAVADPYTGVAVYDSYAPSSGFPYGFLVVGGTSASSPFIAGMYARAGKNTAVVGPNPLYADSSTAFNDVTLGTNAGVGYCAATGYDNALCDARKGWDGPSGRGSPKGLGTFTPATNA